MQKDNISYDTKRNGRNHARDENEITKRFRIYFIGVAIRDILL